VVKKVLEKPTKRRRNTPQSHSKQPGFPPAGLEGGQALAEFAFAFPLQLFIIFCIMQLALLYVGKQMVTYASYRAARAAIVAEDDADAYARARRTAALVCSPITGATVAGSNFTLAELQSQDNVLEVPGWGAQPKSGISYRLKTYVHPIRYPAPGEVEVTVTHYYELVFPVVNWAFAWLVGSGPHDPADAFGQTGTASYGDEPLFEEAVGIWNIEVPHMRLRETTRLSVPGATE
jgi:hypothetical protein